VKVKKIDEYNYKLDCNYMEITAIDYSLSYVKKIIWEENKTVEGADKIMKLESTDIIEVINKMLLEIKKNY